MFALQTYEVFKNLISLKTPYSAVKIEKFATSKIFL